MWGNDYLSGGPRRVAALASLLVFLTGIAVLLGWTWQVAGIITAIPGEIKMAPLTALGFVLAGLALGAAILGKTVPRWLLPARYAAVLVLLIGVYRLAASALNRELGIDMLVFHESSLADPTRMASATALCFLLAGSGLLLAGTGRGRLLQGTVLTGALISWVAFSHFLYGGEPLFQFHYMAFHTCLAFFVLYAGILCLREESGLVGLLAGGGASGRVARTLIPAALVVPMAVGWASLYGQRFGWHSIEGSVSLVALSCVVVFGGLIWATAAKLRGVEAGRRKAESALDESVRRTQAIVDSSEDAIISKTLAGIITSWNPGAERVFGYTAAEAIGQSVRMLIPAHLLTQEEAILERLRYGQSTQHLEAVRRRKDGTLIDVSLSMAPIRGDDGTILGASKIARDITDRKRGEIRIQTQLARLELLERITRSIGERQDLRSIFQVVIRTLEDHLPVDFGCILLYDAPNQTLTVNSVGVRSAALALELAMPEKAVLPIDANGLSRCVLGNLVYEPDLIQVAFPFPQRLAQGGLRSLVLAPLSVESEVFGVLAVARGGAEAFSSGECEFLRQLSEHTALAAHQAQLVDALQRAYDDLRQTQQAVLQQERLRAFGEMASGVAHDINNTLSPAMIYAQLLMDKEPGLSEASRGHLATILQAINDVSETIARLREFYRQREPQLTLAPIPLNTLARQVVELTRPRWNDMPQQRGVVVRMETDLEPGQPEISGAESELREALINLVFNAVDAMPQGGVLTLRTRAEGRNVRLEVTDTGLGMSEETRRRCLEPFYTTKGDSGTGLGLAMVYGIVRRHHADLEIDSAPGQGTTISMVFPVAVPVAAASSAPASARPPRRLRLLVIDDDPLLLKSMRDILEADGHVVAVANGGQAGVDAFHEARDKGEPFDAAITDLGMPYVDGRAVAKALKTASPKTPVILLTGWGKRIVAEQEIPAHVDCVLSKPPKLGELRTALAEWTSAA